MAGRSLSGHLRAALRPFIRFPRSELSLLGVSRNQRRLEGHRLAPACARPGPPPSHFRPRRCYTTSSGELVLSDAQRRTIYALSTPPGKAGVAVIRVSGPDALRVWRSMVRALPEAKGKAREHDPEPWKMHRCSVIHPLSGEMLDDGLAVFFKGARSVPSPCHPYVS